MFKPGCIKESDPQAPKKERPWKVRSSSLVEVTTALVIISMVFGLAMIIYMNVHRTGFSSQKLACEILMNDMYNSTAQSRQYLSKEQHYGDIVIYQEVRPYSDGKDLLLIQLEARDPGGKLIAMQRHIIYVPESNP